VDAAVTADQRRKFGGEMPGVLRRRDAAMALEREGIHLLAADAESEREVLGGLPHQLADDRIGEPFHDADHRRQVAGAEILQRRQLLARLLCRVPVRQPAHHLVGEQQRRMRQCIDAACQHQAGSAALDVRDRGIQRLHAGGAVAHHRPAGHGIAAAHAQRHHAADVDLVGRRAGAAQDHFVELPGAEGLAHQQRRAGRRRQVGGGEGTGPCARLQEGRARTIDDEHIPAHAASPRAGDTAGMLSTALPRSKS